MPKINQDVLFFDSVDYKIKSGRIIKIENMQELICDTIRYFNFYTLSCGNLKYTIRDHQILTKAHPLRMWKVGTDYSVQNCVIALSPSIKEGTILDKNTIFLNVSDAEYTAYRLIDEAIKIHEIAIQQLQKIRDNFSISKKEK